MTWNPLYPKKENKPHKKDKSLSEIITIDNLIAVARKKHYRIFESYKNPLNLNIWVIRANNQKAGSFDDIQVVFWKDVDGWHIDKYTCTADPSDHYLLNPINKQGTAIVKPGQYKGVWKLGSHKGSIYHPALVQHTPITVIRDFNKDAILDYSIPENLVGYTKEVEAGKSGNVVEKWYDENGILKHVEDTGYFGINNHRAHSTKIKKIIGKYSAGCIVQNDPDAYLDYIDNLLAAAKYWGDSFTLTLVTEETLRNVKL